MIALWRMDIRSAIPHVWRMELLVFDYLLHQILKFILYNTIYDLPKLVRFTK